MTFMIIIMIIFIFMTFHCTHFEALGASLSEAENTNVHGLQDLNSMEERGEWRERKTHIKKVSGGDEREDNKGLILEKFRALLGLESFKLNTRTSKTHFNGDFEYGYSPSPSPSPTIEAPVPAPAPVLHIHGHSHPPSHHHRLIKPSHKIDHDGDRDRDRDRAKRTLLAVVGSVGATSVICAIGLFFFCRKFKRQRKRSRSRVSVCNNNGGSKSVNSQSSVKKVSSEPDLDLFYINSLEAALDPQPISIKQDSETINTSKCKLDERERSEKEPPMKLECGYASCSGSGEIKCVHEIEESIKYESDGFISQSGDKIIPVDEQSHEDESFHSLYDSHSSCSVSDSSEIFFQPCSVNSPMNLEISSTPISNLSPFSPKIPQKQSQNVQKSLYFPKSEMGFTPPPPPPLPPPRVHVSPSYSSTSSSTQFKFKASKSTTLPVLVTSSPRNSDSSSGSNQTPKHDSSPPPPPPKPPVGVPPPPFPPPFIKGHLNPPKAPPQLPQYTPLMGKNGAPLPKLKPLHWDKVRAAPDRSMVWDKLRSSSFEFDEEMIESLFGYNLQNTIKNDEGKSKSPSPSKHVLEPKRLQNITILAKALNVTSDQVCDALVQGNGLGLQQLESIVKMVPTKEEETKFCSYKGDIYELGSAERFVKSILNIPFAFLRIEAMLYRETFEDEVFHLRKSFSMLEEACKELRSSRLFLKLLEAVLKTGNRMNIGTIRGGARAFKLDALLKLADVKGTDGKTTLLHFVVQEIVRSEGIRVSESIMGRINQKNKIKNAEEREEVYRRMGLELVSGLSIELCNVKKTATIDLDVLASSVSNLSEGMAKLKTLVFKDLCLDEKNGNFVNSMRSFLGYAEKNIKELQEDESGVLVHVREITEYFHGNVSKDEANPLRIFVIVRDFMGMLDHVCKELRSLKIPSSPHPLAPFR